ncbi:HAD family hydrolase [Streptomyces aureus]|uniref:HAD family hydrolase n=1 Tax=Streptomyces aureus TaxID=193461 RepID=A0ABV4SRB1_9ACTN
MLALFDLDNTVIDLSAGLEDWARNFVLSHGLPHGVEAVICGRFRERAHPEDFVDLRAALRLGDDLGDLRHEYVDGIAGSARCFPGVQEGLQVLRSAGWTIGIATNGAGDIQRAKLTRR